MAHVVALLYVLEVCRVLEGGIVPVEFSQPPVYFRIVVSDHLEVALMRLDCPVPLRMREVVSVREDETIHLELAMIPDVKADLNSTPKGDSPDIWSKI